jgi:hypothetical protein
VPIVKLVSGMLDESRKGNIVLLIIRSSIVGSPCAVGSFRETRRRVYNLLGSGITPEG